MDRGVYAAGSGGLLSQRRLDVVANNLANVNTVGYKAQRLVARQQEFADTLASITEAPARAPVDQKHTPGAVHVATVTDFSPGPINATGEPLNVALASRNEFFVVQTEQGDALTRAGNFQIDAEGTLVTADGKPVLGDGGPISVAGVKPSIASDGTVMVDNAPAGRLRVVTVSDEDLEKLERQEGVRFKLDGAPAAAVETPSLVTASLEMPNVSVVESMVDMIAAHKSFESYAKTVQTISELNDQALRTARTTG